jgi:hypothetical protein
MSVKYMENAWSVHFVSLSLLNLADTFSLLDQQAAGTVWQYVDEISCLLQSFRAKESTKLCTAPDNVAK